MAKNDERAVAYVDVIGWSAAFEAIGHERLLQVAISISDHKQSFSKTQKEKSKALSAQLERSTGITQPSNEKYLDIRFSFVSDCFVISASPWNIENLLNVTRWKCMTLLGDFGFLTRGGITMGLATHDTDRDIVVGEPLVRAVQLEKITSMPRVEISPEVLDCTRNTNAERFVYDDGEKSVLNICGVSDAWMVQCKNKLEAGLAAVPDERLKDKWRYMQRHLDNMQRAMRPKRPTQRNSL